MGVLTILNTVMTAGILAGVWVGVLAADKELKEAVFRLNRFLKEKIDEKGSGEE